MKIFEVEMGDYSIRLILTPTNDPNFDNLDTFYHNQGIKLHPFSITPLPINEYLTHQEYYNAIPVDIFTK